MSRLNMTKQFTLVTAQMLARLIYTPCKYALASFNFLRNRETVQDFPMEQPLQLERQIYGMHLNELTYNIVK